MKTIAFLTDRARGVPAKVVFVWMMLGFAGLALAREPVNIDVLETSSYRIRIEVFCKYGEFIDCNDVRFLGTEKKTGKSLTLIGSTMHRTCGDGTPCQFTGYRFINGMDKYLVYVDDGVLRVERRGQLLLQETGDLGHIK